MNCPFYLESMSSAKWPDLTLVLQNLPGVIFLISPKTTLTQRRLIPGFCWLLVELRIAFTAFRGAMIASLFMWMMQFTMFEQVNAIHCVRKGMVRR